MSLDVTLIRKRWISYDEGYTYEEDDQEVYAANVGGDFRLMAQEAGLYEALWKPYRLHYDYEPSENHKEEMAFEDSVEIYARDILPHLYKGLQELKDFPKHYNNFSGSLPHTYFVSFVERYIQACVDFPEALVVVSR